jgi:lysophospholipase L1-like esterase
MLKNLSTNRERERESKSSHKNFNIFIIKCTTLIFLCDFLCFPLPLFAYPAYTANSNLVIAGPYDVATSGTTNWGSSLVSSRDFITIGNKYRIRQNGTIDRIRIYIPGPVDLTYTTGFYLKIWRKNGTNYDLVGVSNNLASSLVASDFNIIDLSTTITNVHEGDYYGYRLETRDNVTNHPLYAKTGVTGVTTYKTDNSIPSETSYNWESQIGYAGIVVPIEFYIQAPQVVFIGDSIIAGHPNNYSFLETTATTNITSTIEKQFSDLTNYTYQNMGIGGQNTSQIEARFITDVINLHPRIVIIEGGVNDLAQDVVKSTFIQNWTSILDMAQASSGITTILVMKILPWSNGTNVQMQIRDDWNASLSTLARGYSKAIVVDVSSYVGQFRSGGDVENLWDIQTIYDSDGVHFTQAGHAQIAQALADVIDVISPLVPISDPVSGTYNSTQSITLTAVGSDSIRYSTTSTPADCSSEILYTIPVLISTSQTIYVRACDNAGNSSVASFTYVISASHTSGSSALSRYNNLINMGNTQLAEELRKQYPNQITTPLIISPNVISINPSVSNYLFIKNLKQKDINSDVKELQKFLNTHGYLVSTTGAGSLNKETNYFGLKTKQAVIKFQTANDLVHDGIVGPKTREKMK